MHDPRGMGRRQSVGNLHGVAERRHELQPWPGNQPFQWRPRDQLHGNEVRTVDLVDAIDRDDVGVTEGRRGLGFLDEPPLAVRIGDLRRGQNLECHHAIQPQVAGFVDHPHPTFTEGREDLVVGEGATNHCRAIAFLLEVLDEPEFVVSLLRLGIEERTAIGSDTQSTATDWRSWRAFVSVRCGDCRSRSYRRPCD